MTDPFEAFTNSAEQLSSAAVEVVQMLHETVANVATAARDLSATVAAVDTLRATLNEPNRQSGLPPFPDFLQTAVAAGDPSLGPLLAAVRRGPAATASALGKAARRAARELPPVPETPPVAGFSDEAVDPAAEAAIGLLSALHHDVHVLGAHELVGDADPLAVAAVLAAMVLQLAEVATPDVGAWLVEVAANNAATGA